MSKFSTINPVIVFRGLEGRVMAEGQRALRVMPDGSFGVTHKGKVFPVVADANGVMGVCDVIGGAAKAVAKDNPGVRTAKFADIGKQTQAQAAAIAKAKAAPGTGKAKGKAKGEAVSNGADRVSAIEAKVDDLVAKLSALLG